MPKKTFLKLTQDKKEAFIKTALNEFSGNSYSEASVSGIVKDLGIAKGSVYQYFESKEDLYFYLVDLGISFRADVFKIIENKSYDDAQAFLYAFCLVSVKFEKSFPKWASLHYLALNEYHLFEHVTGKERYIKSLMNQFHPIISNVNIESFEENAKNIELLTFKCIMYSKAFTEYFLLEEGYGFVPFDLTNVDDSRIIDQLDNFFK